jgi:hypothetical protein
MRHFLFMVFSISTYLVCSDGLTAQNVLSVKPNFALGDIKKFIVTETEKTSDLIVFSKGTHTFLAEFKVVDTTDGYTINFKCALTEPFKKKIFGLSLKDRIRDSIELTYKLNKEGWLIDIDKYGENQLLALQKIERIFKSEKLSEKEQGLLLYLANRIAKPDGLEILLSPLLLFNEMYFKPSFRPQKSYQGAYTHNIFYQRQISGTMITELDKYDSVAKRVNLSVDFVANEDSALKYYLPIYKDVSIALYGKVRNMPERVKLEKSMQYAINTETGYPVSINYKSVLTCLGKNTTEIKMEMLE